MTTIEQQLRTNALTANVTRAARARIRHGLRTGEITLAILMVDPPKEIRDVVLVDLIRWQHKKGGGPSLACIGRQAVTDKINLMLPTGVAAPRTRAWVAEHGSRSFHRCRQ